MRKVISLAAPTGRAAQRLGEVSGFSAKTIHRLLEWSPVEGRFLRDEENPLVCDVLIVDEASMIDIRLASALLQAVPRGAQVLLIGDGDQLPAVGPGNFLIDLIQSSKVPALKLTEVFRQAEASHIIKASHAINKGDNFDFSNDASSDCHFIATESVDKTLDVIDYLLKDKLVNIGYDCKKDVQILSPMNRGDLGSHAINLRVQELLNSKAERSAAKVRSDKIYPQDKVIQLANNYDLSVFNGDIGFVKYTNVDKHKLLVQFGDREVAYDSDQALDLSLAYAITIHKSQGSEFPVVIIPVVTQHYVMLQRNLIYTALTRARKLAIFVGSQKALNIAIHNEVNSKRQTSLINSLITKLG